MPRTWRMKLLERTGAPTVVAAFQAIALYVALRSWVLVINCFPVGLNLLSARVLGRIWWLLIKRHRQRAMEHLRLALGDRYTEAQLLEIARKSFEHWTQVYLVELGMTPRLITEWTWARHVELCDLGPALRELLKDRAVIMVTPHFGNFELLGYTICKLGIPIHAVMRPLDNRLITDYVMRTRAASGLELIFKRGATNRFQEIFEAHEPLCFIADQDAGRKAVFVDFFGRKAAVYKSIGIAAMHYRIPVIAGYCLRTRPGFHYQMGIERIIQPEEWESRENPLEWLTAEFTHALELSIRRAPEQYLWIHRRWKHRPKEELAAAPPV